MNPFRTALLWASRNPWLQQQVPHWRFVRQAVRRFMPGEQLTDAIAAAQQLNEQGFRIIFTHLGENVLEPEAAAGVFRHYQEVLTAIETQQLPAEISIKLTQLGFDFDPETTRTYVTELARQAANQGHTLWIDMEDSTYVDATLSLYETVREVVPNVGVCLQAYLYRTENDMARLLKQPAAIRLVKGAYREPRQVAFPKKRQVDENYLQLSRLLLEAKQRNPAHRLVFGTHNAALIQQIVQEAQHRQLPTNAYEFHLLYGIRTDVQHRLRHQGHTVGVLISYGDHWYPWYLRRLAERPANLWFVLKHLVQK